VDYLDLGKRIATAIPGMVPASVLVLFFLNQEEFLGFKKPGNPPQSSTEPGYTGLTEVSA